MTFGAAFIGLTDDGTIDIGTLGVHICILREEMTHGCAAGQFNLLCIRHIPDYTAANIGCFTALKLELLRRFQKAARDPHLRHLDCAVGLGNDIDYGHGRGIGTIQPDDRISVEFTGMDRYRAAEFHGVHIAVPERMDDSRGHLLKHFRCAADGFVCLVKIQELRRVVHIGISVLVDSGNIGSTHIQREGFPTALVIGATKNLAAYKGRRGHRQVALTTVGKAAVPLEVNIAVHKNSAHAMDSALKILVNTIIAEYNIVIAIEEILPGIAGGEIILKLHIFQVLIKQAMINTGARTDRRESHDHRQHNKNQQLTTVVRNVLLHLNNPLSISLVYDKPAAFTHSGIKLQIVLYLQYISV